ncbi:Serpin B10 [Papilio xuthus]|uniref:Serpin B10 n=1 Tax=Papilio xuthus TaxID=66420 RepID=A0A194PJT5_PAPXU|nr:Serpin B10 [Papilio xuthus]
MPKYTSPTAFAPNTPIMCYTELHCFYTYFSHPVYPSTYPYLDAINKRQIGLIRHNYVTPAFPSGTRQTGIQAPFNLYGKLNKNPIPKPNIQTDITSNNVTKANQPVFYGALGNKPSNAAANVNNHLLQSLHNPVYKPNANIVEPIRNSSVSATTTNSPTTDTLSYISSSRITTVTTRKPLNFRPNTSYEHWNSNMYSNFEIMAKFIRSLDSLERKFYKATFEKLTLSSPVERKENGISFVQTGIFLHLALMALSSEVDVETRREIEKCIDLELTDREKIYILREIVSSLPKTSDALKFRLSSRFVMGRRRPLKPQFQHGLAPAMRLRIDRLNTTDTAQALTDSLNKMVEKDSKGAMRDTFEEEELSEGMCAVLLSTMYLRARWRSAPTVLNGTHSFLDSDSAPQRTMRMIRINDIMRYTELHEWDAEAIEIFYATPGLSLLLLVPRGRSLRQLAGHVADTSIYHVLDRMYTLRVAVTLPLYTLRMTLLLPNKLQSMGISRLVDDSDAECNELRLSHAVQRLMFWQEAGRNAFKDDGIEWDEAPELELVVNRPYVFFVRWRNVTIMNGHFVL